jgi:hypothetical protein
MIGSWIRVIVSDSIDVIRYSTLFSNLGNFRASAPVEQGQSDSKTCLIQMKQSTRWHDLLKAVSQLQIWLSFSESD